MNGANSQSESDAGPLHLCPVCLRKLHFSVGFDVAERERRLAAVLEEMGLNDDAAWYRKRLERVPQ
jgi:archaemetzincin